MPLQATRNPEHLSMPRDSNCTKQIRLMIPPVPRSLSGIDQRQLSVPVFESDSGLDSKYGPELLS